MGQCVSIEGAASQQERYQPKWQQPAGVMTLDGDFNGQGHIARLTNEIPGDSMDSDRFQEKQQRPRLGFEKDSTTIRVGKYIKIKFGKDAVVEDMGTPYTGIDREQAGYGQQAAHSDRLPETAPDKWTRLEMLGAGAFGRVYRAFNSEGKFMAVKQIPISKEESVAGRVVEHVRLLEQELDVLKHLDHPNIVRYLGTSRDEQHLNIFLELVSGGSIASTLAQVGSFPESIIRVYTRQILLGLEYLHHNKIMHRDIKGANILVTIDGLVKLADFGASKKIEDLVTMDSGFKSIKGTPYWMAPEVIKQTGHGRQADIWSVACTIIEMATGKPPWSQFQSQVSALFHIASSKEPPTIPDVLSREGRDFLLQCFNRVPKERPSASRLLRHPWLADLATQSTVAPVSTVSVHTDMPRVRESMLNLPSPIPEEPASLRLSAGNAPLALRRMADGSPTRMPEPRQFTPRPYSPAQPSAAQHPRERQSAESLVSEAGEVGGGGGRAPSNLSGLRASTSSQNSPEAGRSAQRGKQQGPERLSGSSSGSLGSQPGSRRASATSLQLIAAATVARSFDSDCSVESDYNPVEEPSWLADSIDMGALHKQLQQKEEEDSELEHRSFSMLVPDARQHSSNTAANSQQDPGLHERKGVPSLRIEYTLSGGPEHAQHNSTHSLPSPDYTRAVRRRSLHH